MSILFDYRLALAITLLGSLGVVAILNGEAVWASNVAILFMIITPFLLVMVGLIGLLRVGQDTHATHLCFWPSQDVGDYMIESGLAHATATELADALTARTLESAEGKPEPPNDRSKED